MNRILQLVLILAMVASDVSASEEFRVGVLFWSMSIPGQVAMRQGLEEEAAAINRQAKAGGGPSLALLPEVAGDGPQGIERQIEQMRGLIEKGVDLLIVQPTDNAALAEPLKLANAKNIPVVAYDQYISGGKLAAYRASDNYQAGYLDGEYIASRFADDHEIRLVLVEYPHVSSTVERVDGFLDALEHLGRHYRLLATYQAVEPIAGKRAGEAIVRDFPEKKSIDVVFTVNDGGGLAVVEVLAAAGRDEIQVATIDGDPRSVDNIRAGRLTVIDAAQYCGALGAEAMRAAYALLCKRPTPFHALVPVFPITSETLSRYGGWAGPIADDFDKPWPSDNRRWQGSLRIIAP